MTRLRIGLMWAAVPAVCLALGGCGDSNAFKSMANRNSDQAKKEAALQALADKNYNEAVKLLEEQYYVKGDKSPEVVKYLASAYVGQAGFDTLTLVDDIVKAQDKGGTDSVIYDSVSKIFAGQAGKLTPQELDAKKAFLEEALKLIVPEYAKYLPAGRVAALTVNELADLYGNRSNDQNFQAGMVAALHAVLTIADSLGVDNAGSIPLTLDELKKNSALLTTGFPHLSTAEATSDLATLNADLALVYKAKEVLIGTLATGGDKNKIAKDFDSFLKQIGALDNNSVLQPVTWDTVKNYLLTLVGLSPSATNTPE